MAPPRRNELARMNQSYFEASAPKLWRTRPVICATWPCAWIRIPQTARGLPPRIRRPREARARLTKPQRPARARTALHPSAAPASSLAPKGIGANPWGDVLGDSRDEGVSVEDLKVLLVVAVAHLGAVTAPSCSGFCSSAPPSSTQSPAALSTGSRSSLRLTGTVGFMIESLVQAPPNRYGSVPRAAGRGGATQPDRVALGSGQSSGTPDLGPVQE